MIGPVKTALRPLASLTILVLACCSTTPRPATPTVWSEVSAAREAARSGRDDEAIQRLRGVLARHPAQRGVRRELGLLLAAAGDPDVEAVLAPLAASGPVDPPVEVALAQAALGRAAPEIAARHLARLAASPAAVGVAAYLVKAAIARQRGDLESAEHALRQALILDPGNPEALLGLVRIATERSDDALRAEATERLRNSCPGHAERPR